MRARFLGVLCPLQHGLKSIYVRKSTLFLRSMSVTARFLFVKKQRDKYKKYVHHSTVLVKKYVRESTVFCDSL